MLVLKIGCRNALIALAVLSWGQTVFSFYFETIAKEERETSETPWYL